jgi:hypothetical protein
MLLSELVVTAPYRKLPVNLIAAGMRLTV